MAPSSCLADLDLAKRHPGHVSTFFGEVSPTLQVGFAAVHHISVPRPEGLCSSVLCLVLVRAIRSLRDDRTRWPALFRMSTTFDVAVDLLIRFDRMLAATMSNGRLVVAQR